MEKTLGTRIAALRKEKGLTQEELAEKLGVSSQAVSKWENDLSCPDIMLLPSLAKIFDTTVDELLSGKKEERTVRCALIRLKLQSYRRAAPASVLHSPAPLLLAKARHDPFCQARCSDPAISW